MFCVCVYIEELKTISRGSAESCITTRILQDDDFNVMFFNSKEEAIAYTREGMFDDIYGWNVKGFEVREYMIL